MVGETYTGRFAPSPTGPLHLGSLTTAVASYLEARANGGRWLLRIDDIDAPRAQPGASDTIQRSLEAHGLFWDGQTIWQSQHRSRYEEALAELFANDQCFYCRCSRTQLPPNAPYPGTCRKQRDRLGDAAVRVRTSDRVVQFSDALQGRVTTDLASTSGDFVIWRRDGLPAYQLATAVDDGGDGITHVVRGCDLLDITGRQLHLMHLLDVAAPAYAHLPVVVDSTNVKLSKRTGASPLNDANPADNLQRALALLGLPVATVADDRPDTLLQWAVEQWHMPNLQGQRRLQLP